MSISMLRSRAFLLSAAFTLLVLVLIYHSPYLASTSTPSVSARDNEKTIGFHLLLPATAANKDMCRLLLSSIVTRYPDPILIGWGGHGQWNGTQSHLFKVSETLAYLNALPPEQDDDIVLLLDAYDIFLQLGPDVMIKRYQSAIARHDRRLEEEGILGKMQYRWERKDGDRFTTKTTLLWGADKLCWPSEKRRAACWAAPLIPNMPEQAWGPERPHDNGIMLPRWLNSGTLIGPAKDMRDMLNATMEMIGFEFDDKYMFTNSDQQYFADVWAEQEVGRLRLARGMDAVYGPEADSEVPLFIPERRTEYHIAIDQLSELFQTNAFYSEFMTFMRFNNSRPDPSYPHQHPFSLLPSSDPGRLDHLLLEADILESPSPFSAGFHGNDELPTHQRWADVMLGVNTITGQPFPLYHVTGDKGIRDRWWPRMWFHNPSSERLLRATVRERKHAALEEGIALSTQESETRKGAAPKDMVIAVVDGVVYVARDTRTKSYLAKREGDKGGAWSDTGAYLPWDSICLAHEKDVFVTPRDF